MDSKKIRKSFGRFFGWLGLNVCSLIISFIPWRFLYSFAQGLGNMGYRIAGKQRKIAMQSLSLAFGDSKSTPDKEKIARDCFISMAKSGVELVFLMERPALLKARVRIEGKEHLEMALSRGKGVILVSAHFGNFPLMLAKLSLEGYKTAGIMRFMRDERVEKIFADKRSRLGIKTIYSQPRKACVDESIRVLRENGLLFIPIDQNFGTSGVFVDFFGKKAATATGPIVLAQRTQSMILPAFIVRQPDDRQVIIFEPPIELEEAVDKDALVRRNIQKLTDIIERYIRQYPAEWGWIHRRWKTKPQT